MTGSSEQLPGSSLQRLRQKLWPIEPFELKKIIPLLLLKFFISFNYGILTSMKDTMVVTAKHSGAEAIPVLKGWVVLPMALIVALIYSKLSNLLKKETLFYLIVFSFIFFFSLYAFILYPFQDLLSPHSSAAALEGYIGHQHAHWISLYRNWIPSLFFVFTELWGSIGIGILFWGFANQVTRVHEAKRCYTLFIAGGDLAAILTGPLIWYYTQKIESSYLFTVQSLLSIVILFNLLIIAIHWWLQHKVLIDTRFYDPATQGKSHKKKTKLSLLEGILYISRSKYLRCLAMMVVAYGLTINMVEVTWKANLKFQYPNPSDYQAFMGILVSSVGLISFIVAFFFGSAVIRYFGWHFSAQITPIVVGIGGMIFLGMNSSFFQSYFEGINISPLWVIILLGAIQNVSSKVMKYSFFDPTKEMAYIPLDDESKVKGKAAIDVVGARLGKSGASWIQIALIDLVGTGSILSITSFLTPLVGFVVFAWILSVRSLSHQFEEKSEVFTDMEEAS